jgi:hypothetical protein
VLQPSPLNRNLVLRFTKEGGTKNDESDMGRIARKAREQLKGGKTSRLQNLSVNEARLEETQNKKVMGNSMSFLKRVRTQNFNIKRKGA